MRNFAFHEAEHAPTPWKVELEVGGKITHHEGVISPNGQTGDASDMLVAEFDYDPEAHARSRPRPATSTPATPTTSSSRSGRP